MSSLKFVHNAIGVDEAGRGCLAGPVVAAAVLLDENYDWSSLNDSKKLSEKRRDEFYLEIVNHSKYSIIQKCNKEVDSLNILQATLLAMSEAIHSLSCPDAPILIDGNQVPPNIRAPYECIPAGDAKIINIAAASILAKVTRDKLMKEYALKFPEYSFEKHKGYGTKDHLDALKQYGPCDIHRFSYAPVKKLIRLY